MWENDVDLFVYLNAATMQPDSSFEGPPVGIAKRIRVQREKLRRILMKDLNILWSKRLESFTIVDSGVVAKFGDGTSYEGSILVGADGSHSRVRRSIASEPDLNPLRVSLLGTTVELDHEQATPLLAISPLSILGKDPKVRNASTLLLVWTTIYTRELRLALLSSLRCSISRLPVILGTFATRTSCPSHIRTTTCPRTPLTTPLKHSWQSCSPSRRYCIPLSDSPSTSYQRMRRWSPSTSPIGYRPLGMGRAK